MLPSISFETGRRTQTQSSVRPSVGQDSKWKSASITNRNRGREANTRGEETKKNLYPALLRSASGELLPLDKDLSWKSASCDSACLGAAPKEASMGSRCQLSTCNLLVWAGRTPVHFLAFQPVCFVQGRY